MSIEKTRQEMGNKPSTKDDSDKETARTSIRPAGAVEGATPIQSLVKAQLTEAATPGTDIEGMAQAPRYFCGHEDQWRVPTWAPQTTGYAPTGPNMRAAWTPNTESRMYEPLTYVSNTRFFTGFTPETIRQSGFAPPTEFHP